MRVLSSILSLALLSVTTAAVGCAASDDDTSATDADASGFGRFELWQSADSQWHAHLKSGNGAILLTSESYTSRTAAITGVLATETDGVDPAAYQIVPATHGYLLHLVAANNEVIGSTQVYATKASAARAITSCTNAVTSYLDKRQGEVTGARIAFAYGDSGAYHFDFVAANGQIVLTSQAYQSEASAYDGAFAVQGAAAAAYTVLPNTAGGFYFTVTATNGQVIGTSQQYTTKQSAQAGAAAVQKLAPTLSVL